MTNNIYVEWMLEKQPDKEHVSFSNFVKVFGFTTIHSSSSVKVGEKSFVKKIFWSCRVLEVADRKLYIDSETVAKETGADILIAGRREARHSLRKYPSRASEDKPLEIVDDSENSNSVAGEPNQKLTRPKRSSAEVALELESASVPDQELPTKKVVFQGEAFSSEGGSDYVGSNPSSARSSLNSIDFKFVYHLVGQGTTSSRLKTSSQLVVGETNVLEVVMNVRRDILRKQSEISVTSDLL
ncbi:hypothetical protein BGW38_010633 [Lunasporangiospora selenospora]|uniref:Uncharacterized protein n=1 Tax=Lunasporangiospora selenospora TaxID=979761 RepID=A0A9P6KFE7_9FUNG|nr:hypothetical protein BGW38_010633 [Lunasporangiospora selenospora]